MLLVVSEMLVGGLKVSAAGVLALRLPTGHERRNGMRCVRQSPRSVVLPLVLAALLTACAPAPKSPKPLTTEVVEALGKAVDARLQPLFARARVPYPPTHVHLLAFKQERKIELWAQAGGGPVFIRSYPVLLASGKTGPKLAKGDWQVPEGIYAVTSLNPASNHYLSLKLDYPNAFDRQKAAEENRTNLGGDIFIHGKGLSRGCLAVGDAAIEELFVLAARVGAPNLRVIITPNDLRQKQPPADTKYRPVWLSELYTVIRAELASFRLR